jgi:tol-pal system protein YbgF
MRKHFAAAAVLAAVLACAPSPAHAVSTKDAVIQLQTQVQQLLDMMQRLQSSFDTRFGVLQNLAQQTANQANQMSTAVSDLQKKLDTQNEGVNGKIDSVSGQIQSLNDSVDELRTRVDKLQKTVQDLQTQLQNIQTPPPGSVPGAEPGMQPNGQTPGAGPQPGSTQGQSMNGQGTLAPLPAAAQAPPLKQTYEAALADYNAGRDKMAASEFQQVVTSYPYDQTAGTAQFYLGEIAYRQKDYSRAVDAYNAMLETFPGNPQAPAAQLHKGYALLELHRTQDGIRELRQLIQRYPRTPEASHARSRLNGMGVRITPR